MKKRYSEEQIIKAIKEHEAGAKVDDICRNLGISSGMFYNWRSKYAGLEVNVTAVKTTHLPLTVLRHFF
jgi:putative transposase